MSKMSVDPIYREHIIDHYRHPRNFGNFDSCDIVRRESNFSCGDDLEFFLKTSKGKVDGIRFRGQGCALSVAAASMLSEKAVGMKIKDIEAMTESDIVKMLGVGDLHGSRLRCATLGLKGLKTGISDWKKNKK